MKKIMPIFFIGLYVLCVNAVSSIPHTSSINASYPSKTTSTKIIDLSETIPFEVIETRDNNMRRGTAKTLQEGSDGKKQVKYKVSHKDGKEVEREKINEVVITQMIPKKVVIGTKQFYSCSNGTDYDTIIERDNCEKRVKWEEQKNASLKECYNDSSKTNCWYDEYPGTTLHWSYYTHTYTPTTNANRSYRTGAICMDGWRSHSTGRGTCSHHGGVNYWLY